LDIKHASKGYGINTKTTKTVNSSVQVKFYCNKSSLM